MTDAKRIALDTVRALIGLSVTSARDLLDEAEKIEKWLLATK